MQAYLGGNTKQGKWVTKFLRRALEGGSELVNEYTTFKKCSNSISDLTKKSNAISLVVNFYKKNSEPWFYNFFTRFYEIYTTVLERGIIKA